MDKGKNGRETWRQRQRQRRERRKTDTKVPLIRGSALVFRGQTFLSKPSSVCTWRNVRGVFPSGWAGVEVPLGSYFPPWPSSPRHVLGPHSGKHFYREHVKAVRVGSLLMA